MCIYVVLNDTIPFRCQNDQEIVQKQLKREWKFRAKYENILSNNLKILIRQMLEPDMNLRITIQDVASSAWLTNLD